MAATLAAHGPEDTKDNIPKISKENMK